MKLNTQQYIIFNIYLLLGTSSLTINNTFMKNEPSSAFFIPLLTLPIILLLSSIINFKKDCIKKITNNSVLKYILFFYLLISSFIFIINYLVITNDYFYKLTPPLIILIILLLTSIFLSSYGIKNIIFIGFIFSIFIFILEIICILFNIQIDFTLLNHLNIQINNKLYLFNYIFLYLDILLIPLFCNYQIKFKNNLIIYSISIVIQSLLIFNNYLIYPHELFIYNKIPYLSKYMTISTNTLFEHFDICYLIIITIFFIFKLAINNEIYRIIFKIKRSSYKIYLFSIILIILSYIANYFKININIINYLMFSSSILLLLFYLIFKSLSGGKHEKRNN